jgi:hypothetical protein
LERSDLTDALTSDRKLRPRMLPMEHSSIIARLDENWRTVVEIRSRLGGKACCVSQLAATLRRLADAGYIERAEQETPAPKRERYGLAGRLSIQLYRQRSGPA